MSQDTEVDMKEVELNELEPEKQPMNAAPGALAGGAGGEKNGLVKIKVADDDEAEPAAKFTGLSKEELLKVAGSPGWVRTRWALLLLFWLGWLGMLAGAVVIIVQAPRCRELPKQSWWHQGALYRIGDLPAFLDSDAGLAGLEKHLDYLNTLKVKGLVLGPIHKNQKDDILATDLEQIDSSLGSKDDFKKFLQLAKKKSIRVILDLTPNYKGQNLWFLPTQNYTVAAKMKDAMTFWLQAGVDGFQIRDVEDLKDPSLHLAEWQNITKNFSEDRILIAGMKSEDPQQILSLLESNKDILLTNSYMAIGMHVKSMVTQYMNATSNSWRSWSISQAGLLSSFVEAKFLRLYQLLFFTLPGTPIFSFGDEIGLEGAATLPGQPGKAPVMPWKGSDTPGSVSPNITVKSQEEDSNSLLSLFKRLSDQRGKERSLLHGDFHMLNTEPTLFSYVRQWDQNTRFMVVLNFGDEEQTFSVVSSPTGVSLPAKANLVLSTEPGFTEGASVDLQHLNLKPHQGLLLHFPYEA